LAAASTIGIAAAASAAARSREQESLVPRDDDWLDERAKNNRDAAKELDDMVRHSAASNGFGAPEVALPEIATEPRTANALYQTVPLARHEILRPVPSATSSPWCDLSRALVRMAESLARRYRVGGWLMSPARRLMCRS
jgi:hypothetical protein